VHERFEIVGLIERIETIASGTGIQRLAELQTWFGRGHWRKLKGVATIRMADGTLVRAELHWYEAHGIGKRQVKIKRFLE
jgi:hypothetical protein